MSNCPLCCISQEEKPIFENELVYLVPTKDLKGHLVRVMVAIKRHGNDVTFKEQCSAHAILHEYMKKIGVKNWSIVDSTFAQYPDHWHTIACDEIFTQEKEYKQFQKTDHVSMPILPYKVLIVIPAFNEEKTIWNVVSEAKAYGKVVVIDDGSTDTTLHEATNAGAFIISHGENKGYGLSLKEAFEYASFGKYDILITLDADGQHDPSEIPFFIKTIENGVDVVIGNRFTKKSNTPLHRKLVVKFIGKVFGVKNGQCGFRAFGRNAIENIKISNTKMGASLQVLDQAKKLNLKVKEIPCNVNYDVPYPHKQSMLKQGFNLIETLLWMTIWKNPLVYLGIPGAIFVVVGIISFLNLMLLYVQFREFVLSWAVLSLGGLFMGLLFCFSAIIVYLFKKGLVELKSNVKGGL